MAYLKLQFLKALKSGLSWLILGVGVMSAGLILIYNAASGDQTLIRTQVTQDLNQRNKEQARAKSKLALRKNDQSVQANVAMLTDRIKSDHTILKALDKNGWHAL